MANLYAGKCILTIDLGTSGPKVALVSTEGDVLALVTGKTSIIYLENGGAEQDPKQWWQSIKYCMEELFLNTAIDKNQIIGIACTSQWSGTVAVGSNGQPLMNAIIWMDARGAPYVRQITKGRIQYEGYGVGKLWNWVRKTGGIPTHSGKDSIAHILYIKNCLPKTYEDTYKFLEPKDYLNFKLTGRFAASHESIAVHWLTDNRNLARVRYDNKLIAMSQLDREKLPDLKQATDILGPIDKKIAEELKLPADIPVLMGTPDVHSAAIGSGAVEDYAGHLYVGTSSWLTCHVPFKKTDPIHNMASLPSALPNRYLVMNEQQTAGAALNFLKDRLIFAKDGKAAEGIIDTYKELNEMASRVPAGSNRVIFTPWLYGERTPVEDRFLRAGFYNLSLNTTRSEMSRAVFEGVAFNSRWLLKYVEKFIKRPMDTLHFIGGGARSNLWCQIHADILGRTIKQIKNPVAANSRGVGLLAAMGLGECSREEITSKVEVSQIYQPNEKNRKLYDALFKEFITIYRQNKKMYARLAGLEEVA